MTIKFGRDYRLTIYPIDGTPPILVTMPTTVSFSIIRNISSNQNLMELQIYNLSKAHRNSIYKDWYQPGDAVNADGSPAVDPATGQPLGNNNIIFEAGYANLFRIFYGHIWRASSSRDGTNIVTSLCAWDNTADIPSTQIFETLQSGQTLGQVLQYLVSQFPNIKAGMSFNYPLVFNRPVVLNGFVWDLLKQYSNNSVYIDNGKLYILRDNEVLNDTAIIDDSTGILGTPRKEQSALYITTLFEPGIYVGQQVKIQSTVSPNYNNTYKVNGIQHSGMISGAVCGKLTTTMELLAPNPIIGFTAVNQL